MTKTRTAGSRVSVPWYKWVVLGMFIVTIITMIYTLIIRTPKAKYAEEQLQREFNSIAVFPQATTTHSNKSYKDAQALVVSRYSTLASYSEIRAYYDTELPKNGWKFVSERTVTDWGRELGGKIAHYCKGDWSADVEYMGKDSNGRGDYALSLSWRINGCQ